MLLCSIALDVGVFAVLGVLPIVDGPGGFGLDLAAAALGLLVAALGLLVCCCMCPGIKCVGCGICSQIRRAERHVVRYC